MIQIADAPPHGASSPSSSSHDQSINCLRSKHARSHGKTRSTPIGRVVESYARPLDSHYWFIDTFSLPPGSSGTRSNLSHISLSTPESKYGCLRASFAVIRFACYCTKKTADARIIIKTAANE